MKKRLTASIAASILYLFSATASADSVLHIWSCKLHEGTTPADIEKASADWLKAAKSMDGGAELEVYIEFPIAANAGNNEFSFVLVANDAKTWGIFNNEYDDSAAAEADEAWFELASCSKSSIWNSIEIK